MPILLERYGKHGLLPEIIFYTTNNYAVNKVGLIPFN